MLDYKGLSDMLAGIYSAHTDEFEIDRPLSEGLTAALCAEFDGISSAIIYGGRQKKVMVISDDAKTLAERAHVIAARLRDALKIPFDYKEREGSLSNGVLLFTQSKAFTTSAGYLSLNARGEEKFCGDTVKSFEGCEGIYYTAVCDGMGAGKEAALASRICAMFLEKTLSACTSVQLALRQLNLFMRHRNTESLRECSSGVDLLAIDPVLSRATFYKSGAAPSFVFRESNVYKVESKTLPLGIIRELDVKKTAFDLRVGDTVVMISDGVLRSQGDCPWLLDIMKKCAATHSPETLSAMIAKRAQKENGNDDISVAVIKIIDC
jgi:stage II sporulation protein E